MNFNFGKMASDTIDAVARESTRRVWEPRPCRDAVARRRYGPEEMDAIMSACRVDCQKKQITPTKTNIFAQYVVRVRRNMHVCLCMSPLGETFRERLRQFRDSFAHRATAWSSGARTSGDASCRRA